MAHNDDHHGTDRRLPEPAPFDPTRSLARRELDPPRQSTVSRPATTAAAGDGISALDAARHSPLWLATGLLAGLLIGVLYVSSRPAGATASAHLVLRDPWQADISTSERPVGGDFERFVRAQARFAGSEQVLDAAAERLQTAFAILDESVRSNANPASDMIVIEVDAPSPAEAEARLDAVISSYSELRRQVISDEIDTAVADIDAELAALEDDQSGAADALRSRSVQLRIAAASYRDGIAFADRQPTVAQLGLLTRAVFPALGAIAGAGLALVAAWIRADRQPRLDDVEALAANANIRFLGTIPLDNPASAPTRSAAEAALLALANVLREQDPRLGGATYSVVMTAAHDDTDVGAVSHLLVRAAADNDARARAVDARGAQAAPRADLVAETLAAHEDVLLFDTDSPIGNFATLRLAVASDAVVLVVRPGEPADRLDEVFRLLASAGQTPRGVIALDDRKRPPLSFRRRAARTRTDPSRALDIGVYGARGVPSTYSGYETFLTTMLPELVRRGDQVTMYCRPGDGMENTAWEGVERKVVPALPGKNLNTLSHGLVAGLAARRARHDVLLAVNVANAPFCLIGRYTGQPVVLNTDGQEWLRDKWGRAARAVFHGSARIARRCATGLIADSAAMADVYRDEFKAESTIIPYCVTDLDWTPDASTPGRYGLAPFKYLLIAGRHNPENNLDRVAQLIHESDLDVPLVVLGTANYDSPVTRTLTELAGKDPRIMVLGHVGNRDEFFDLVHHATVYLHGHSVGGTNPSLIEAMAARARICALDNSFNRETVGDTGRYFRLDPADLVPTLRTIMSESPTNNGRIRMAAEHRAEDRFSIKTVVDAYRDVLATAARTKRGTVALPTRWSAE